MENDDKKNFGRFGISPIRSLNIGARCSRLVVLTVDPAWVKSRKKLKKKIQRDKPNRSLKATIGERVVARQISKLKDRE